jgi:hypothetical protein
MGMSRMVRKEAQLLMLLMQACELQLASFVSLLQLFKFYRPVLQLFQLLLRASC